MNHTEYPKSLKSRSDSALRFIIRDATEAIEANPDNPNNSYYADEIDYCSDEIQRRKNVKKGNPLQELNKMMLNALKEAEPWLILLGDKIGNGIPSDPNGRCRAVLAVRNAIAKAENE